MQAPLQFWQDPGGRVWVTRIGRGWVAVPGEAWAAFTAKVKRGDYDST